MLPSYLVVSSALFNADFRCSTLVSSFLSLEFSSAAILPLHSDSVRTWKKETRLASCRDYSEVSYNCTHPLELDFKSKFRHFVGSLRLSLQFRYPNLRKCYHPAT